MSATPELDKQAKAIEQGSQEIGAFLDWMLNEQGFTFARWGTYKDEIECTGLARDGRPNGIFDGTNCANGEVGRHRVTVDDKTYMVGDECPRCEGTARIEVDGREGFIPDSRGVQQLLADYFEIDLQAIERERRALLEEIREHQH